MSVRIFIPARMASERLPGKPLRYIDDKTILEHVHSRAIKTGLPVTVLTDSFEVKAKFPKWDVVVTDDCYSGTDRIASVVSRYSESFIINCQGDLPFIKPYQILQSLLPLEHGEIGTLIAPMMEDKIDDPNTVKAITSNIRDNFYKVHWCGRGTKYGYHHIGVYSFHRDTLLTQPKKRSYAESIENLEQLRWLENDYSIAAFKTDETPFEVNTLEDLNNAIVNYSVN